MRPIPKVTRKIKKHVDIADDVVTTNMENIATSLTEFFALTKEFRNTHPELYISSSCPSEVQNKLNGIAEVSSENANILCGLPVEAYSLEPG